MGDRVETKSIAGFIPKPYSFEMLLGKLRAALKV
jgi:hypothetical protein